MSGYINKLFYGQTKMSVHDELRLAGQMNFEDYKRELIESGELAEEAVAQEVELNLIQE